MKKIILFVCFVLTFTSSCLATPLDHLLFNIKKHEKTTAEPSRDRDEDGYTNFSGVWVGTCDDDPDRTEVFNIKMTDNSSLIVDGKKFDIDAVSTESTKNNLNFEESVLHYRWNEEGSQLLGTGLYYHLGGYMAMAKMETFIGKMTIAIENNQLVIRSFGYFYSDAIHQQELDTKTTCTYIRESN